MLLVYIPGCWDLLHVGHIAILERARALGDRLVVGVASDEVVKEDKGRLPIITLDQRVAMLNSLKCVDLALPYFCLSFISHLAILNPDILAIGESWGNEERHISAEEWIESHRKRIHKLPYTKGISTTAIIEKVKKER